MKKIFNILFKVFRLIFYSVFWFICIFFPVDNHKIVISSYRGRGYGDNPKYIINELLKQNTQLSIIWLIANDNEKENLPSGVIGVKNNSLKGLYHLYTAKIWIDNCRKSLFTFKRKKQFYIQTWHGFALKRIEKDVVDKLTFFFPLTAKSDSNKTDCIISCSDFMTKIYSNSFWYNGPIYTWGAPRNDIIIKNDSDCINKVYSKFNIPSEKKIILYAPTFRNNLSLEPYSLDYNRVKTACEKKFGGEFVVLVRLHPNIAKKSKNITFDNVNIFDATYYSDMQELLCTSHVVISDYSSLIFDFALSGKPCFQFATDIEDYKNDRNFYFELDKLPFSIAKDNDELENDIIQFNQELYKKQLDDFYSSVGMVLDGNASVRCAELIMQKCGYTES